ncbi:hypothetical protein D0Z07_7628 [Hyphodiscus hymeniophilus]|uniref:Uncharacterized protein n=1 Tax=Hyphodiscus hymeniophilus TaxID=353542 RepID=A0A9P7AU48_9HELO|nr:hypothetical protein D0Z07_7628 [Hyphodiscus hymeniophilus]
MAEFGDIRSLPLHDIRPLLIHLRNHLQPRSAWLHSALFSHRSLLHLIHTLGLERRADPKGYLYP